MKRTVVGGILLTLMLVGCSGPTPFAVVASSNGSIGTGEQRVLVALIDRETDQYLAAIDRQATLTLRDENGAPLDSYDMSFVWTIPGARGIYAANVVIPEAGTYQVEIDAEGLERAGPAGFVAVEDPPVVQVGEPAPRSESKVAADFPDLSLISSDPNPDPAFYQLSVAEAVSNGTPAVIVFATPAWCVTQTCGPTLDLVKDLSAGFSGVDFVHVEVYEDIQVGSFDELELVPSVAEWGLLAEPWVFVVDSAGVVTGSFEGAAAEEELRTAIQAVAA